jgi:hypothetical protein
MPTTYTPLETTTLGSSQASVTLSVISGAYTDLVLVISAQGTTAGNDQDINMTFNSDTGSNYSRVRLYGNGTSALSTRNTNASNITIGNMPAASSVLGSGNSIIQIQNYSNNTTFKTSIIRTNTSSTYGTVFAIFGMWRSTAAITSITLTPAANSFAAGSTFSLYGVASAAVVSGVKATGGDVVATDGTYWYHAFRTSGTFTPTQALTADVLVVAGGGAGNFAGAGRIVGGGGAGGLLAHTSQSLSATGHTVTVGAGGSLYTNGSNSQFGGLTASVGGGLGGGAGTQGNSGGSGGGGGDALGAGGAGTASQGNTGGNGSTSGNTGGGGGGAGAVGSNGTASTNGKGGVGVNTYSSWANITGTGDSGYFAGGGGGGLYLGSGTGTSQSAALGGGGLGGTYWNGTTQQNPTVGTANTGGGGGGYGLGVGGGTGGSGIVIVRYPV